MSTQLFGAGGAPVAQGLFQESSLQNQNLGAIAFANDGRVFRYAQAGEALVAGNLNQCIVEDTGDQNLSVAAAVADATSVVTTSTVTVTANQYAEGYLVVASSTGLGYSYKISGHAAATAAVVTINLIDPLKVAIAATTTVDLIPNPYDGVINFPTAATGSVAGVSNFVVTSAYYAWLQVAGVTAVEAQNALTVGLDVVASNDDAGCVETITDGAHELLPHVGTAVTGCADAEFGLVHLKIF